MGVTLECLGILFSGDKGIKRSNCRLNKIKSVLVERIKEEESLKDRWSE